MKVALGVGAYLVCLGSLFAVPEDVIGWYATIWVGITVVLTVYFVVGYALFSDWKGSQEGWHVLSFSALIAVASTWSFVQLLIIGPANVPASYGRAVVWISVAFSMGWRAWLWTSRQISVRRKNKKENASC